MDAKEKAIFKAIAAYIPQHIVEERVLYPRLRGVHGQFRQGTLVFADISGFTAMSEKLSELGKEGAEELTNILNRYFTRMLNIAWSYRGNQLKFGGDAMLLLFLGQRHAARAVRCALKMQQAMREFGQVPTSKGGVKLEMSIGINSGEFFEASVGLPKERLHLIFTGREINRTAQVEAVARAGEIFIGSGTLQELRDKVEIGMDREGHYPVRNLRARVKSMTPYERPREEKASEHIIETLESYLPRQLVERIKVNPEQAEVEGEHRKVAVMFVNILGSSMVVEEYGKRQLEEITRILNDYFQIAEATVNKYGGVVIGCDLSTKGDKLLAILGAPVAHENDEERALLCALEMKQRLADSGLPLQQRIGINTGYVFAGEVGSPLRKEYTVMGDAVNLAARLMGVAEEGQIIIGQSTYSKIEGKFVLHAQKPVKVKGKSQAVSAYLVERRQGEKVHHRQLGGAKLVGREKELAVLQEVIERAFSGQGQLLAITGPAGIGKSRLVEEMKGLWGGRGGSTCSGNCQSYGANIPYLPWIDLLNGFFNLQEGDTAEQRREKIETIMANLCPELRDWTAVIGGLLSVPIPESDLLKSLDPKLRHQRLLDITLELLQAQAKRFPLLLLFEDLHWADTASVELLNYMARNIREYPLLVCIVYRPEVGFEPQAKGQDNYTAIVLGELSTESTMDLMRSIANMRQLPQELSRLVVTRSQGNPLFVEEVVKSLMGAGHLRLDSTTGEYQMVGDLRQLQVPETIEGVIMARLDQLAEGTRNVLRVASVIGRNFQDKVLKDIYPSPIASEELQQRLEELTSLGLIFFEREGPVPEHSFQHILTREVAYDSLLFARRRELHYKVGEYFEKHYANRLEEYYELLFYHYNRTRDKGKALEYSVKAGDKAKMIFANQEAIGYYHRALELTAELPHSAGSLGSKVRENMGDIYELTGQYDQALESYQTSQQWYETLERRTRHRQKREVLSLGSLIPGLPSVEERVEQITILCRKRGMVYERKGQYGDAIEWLDRGLSILGEDGGEKARLFTAKAGVLYRRGDHAQALDWCQQGLDIAHDVADLDEMAHSYYLLANIYADLGKMDEVVEYHQRSLSIYEEAKDLPGQAKVHNNLGVDYYYQGEWDKAAEHYHKSLEIREKIGDVNGVATVSNNLGEVLSDQWHLDEAIESFLKCLKTWERTGYLLGVGLSYSNLGRAYTRRGDCHKALEHLRKSVEILEQVQAIGLLADVYQRLAEAYLGIGQVETALQYCEHSLALAQERKMTMVAGTARRTMGQVYHSLGQWNKAEESLTVSQRLLQEVGASYELSQTLWELALLYCDMEKARYQKGLETKIRQPLEEAIALFEKLGVRFDAAKAAELRLCYGIGAN